MDEAHPWSFPPAQEKDEMEPFCVDIPDVRGLSLPFEPFELPFV